MITTPGCDPTTTTCGVRVEVSLELKGTSGNNGISPGTWTTAIWKDGSSTIGECGTSFGARITQDLFDTWIEFSGFSCISSVPDPGDAKTYALEARTCNSASCAKFLSIPVNATPSALNAELCPKEPLEYDCNDGDCQMCAIGPAGGGGLSGGGGGSGGASAAGGGPSAGGAGENAYLNYRAGGVGGPGQPGTVDHSVAMGRYWIHTFAERLVEVANPSPNAGEVWLLAESGSFRHFIDVDGDDIYETRSPGDEYRTLEKTVTGFELRDLDGTIDHFDASGLWTQTVDRNGNATVASYTGTVLDEVDRPDGISELFDYHVSGKLASITYLGVDGTSTRIWEYTWSGDDLVRIDRPDGTALEFLYDDSRHPGWMTRKTLVGTDGTSERVLTAWEFDDEGNVTAVWRGAATKTDADAVDLWQLSYDDPVTPTETTVTDPLGVVSIYTLDTRASASEKPKLLELSGSCPSCSLGPNTELVYGDSANPFRPTEEVDGRGTVTRYEYDLNGMMTSRIDAFLTALERETTWEYDVTYPALVTEVEQPSVEDPMDFRRTSWAYDVSGNAETVTQEGLEDGLAFSLDTDTTFNSAGQPLTVDPPGHGAADETSFTYDSARGDLVMLTRVDAIVGTTTYGYDAFNRRTTITDVNGVITETTYDDLHRVLTVTQRGAVQADDLVTEHRYTVFGDLFQTVLPRGNVIEYGYDAAGRVVSVERKPDDQTSSHGERTVYTLDEIGHRVREEHQRWDAQLADWSAAEFVTEYEYSTRCHLDKVIAGAGSASESVTEYAYDCEGNLEREWDANHPSSGQTATATTAYAYDELDRLETTTQPWGGTGGGTVVTTYSYDVQDHLVAVEDGEGNVTEYDYSDRDLLIEERSPVSGTTEHSYDEHGQLTSTTDARSVTVAKTYDALDRVTFVDYPDNTLDITYTYDDPMVAFSTGRLTAITRNGESVDYAYDRFGRMTQDGELAYGYDKNGNRIELGYPGGVVAHYTFDFADRQSTLEAEMPDTSVQSIVTASTYYPFGPLRRLDLGNGVVEEHRFDTRYFPDEIEVTAQRNHLWAYTVDGVGNPTEIEETESCLPTLTLSNQALTGTKSFIACDELTASPDVTIEAGADVTFAADEIGLGSGFSVASGAVLSVVAGTPTPTVATRTYGYQDYQYFLTSADGAPWGSLDWTYDRIGNRLSEDRNSVVDTYTYVTNGGGGNTAKLAQAGTRVFAYDNAGNTTQMTAGGNQIDYGIDDASRIAEFARPIATAETALTYDGRSFLARSEELLGGGPDIGFAEPTYSTAGVIHSLHRQSSPSDPEERIGIFYFAGRPVAQRHEEIGASTTWLFLATDHLMTPNLATSLGIGEEWHGPFEPFGRDFFSGTSAGASANGVFMRLPGQWEDATWRAATSGAETVYNLFRWYDSPLARYTAVDPLGLDYDGARLMGKAGGPTGSLAVGTTHPYGYVDGRPLVFVDTDGLHREGGPWHSDRPLRCRESDNCKDLGVKISLLSHSISSHRRWDRVRGVNRHEQEIRELINAIERCKGIYEKKCLNNDCKPCEKIKEVGPVVVGAYLVYKTIQLLLCPVLVPVTP